jgi:predicted methyltransferase
VLAKLLKNKGITAAERNLILNYIFTREYNYNVLMYKLFAHVALSGYAYTAIYCVYTIEMLKVFKDSKEEVKSANRLINDLVA